MDPPGYGSPDGCLGERGARDDVMADGGARVVGGFACVEPEFVVGVISVGVGFKESVIRTIKGRSKEQLETSSAPAQP
jgi:hypothetical protein